MTIAEQTGRYTAPTYKQFDDEWKQWQEFKRQAAALPYSEAMRHARVSLDNRHRCENCFCCAALQVINELTSVEMSEIAGGRV